MIKILSSDINQKSDVFYDKVADYVIEVLDFYINAMKCIKGTIPKKDIENTLYQSSFLDTSTINTFFPPLLKDKKKKDSKQITSTKTIPKDIAVKKKNVAKLISPTSNLVNKHVKKYQDKYLAFFEDLKANIPVLIKGKPSEMVQLEKNLRNRYRFIKHHVDKYSYRRNISNLMKKVFDYEKFASKARGLPNSKNSDKWTHYDLAKLLKINTCSYCNRIYTFTVFKVTGEGAIAPQFDHFFDKRTRPIFALSFFNLIPSCNFCNSSLKGTTKFSLEKYIHPYDTALGDKVTFTYFPKSTAASVGESDDLQIKIFPKVGLSIKEKVERTIKIFELEMIYTQHADYVSESIRKKYAYNDKYLDIIRNQTFFGFRLGIEEAYRLAFGNYYLEKDFHKRPLAKLTKDIVKELGFI